MSRNILLLEPNYNNKFPPIGLMKIATYFRLRKDNVVFYKGDLREFLVRDITDDCIAKLADIDPAVNWRLRADKISRYIKYRRSADLHDICIDDSRRAALLYPWMEHYKNYYYRKEYLRRPKWDWVGVTTLFTFYWDITIETILFAKTMVKDVRNLMVGGVLASLQPEAIEAATGIKPHCGTLHTPFKDIDPDNKYVIDELPLDYSILDEIDHVYVDSGAFFSYTTRGCVRRCPFCAVPTIEPEFQPYIPLRERIEQTRRFFGDQQHLLLMDNNVLASEQLGQIVADIRSCGFTPGAKYVEPNQYHIAIRNLRLRVNDRAYIRKAWRLLREINDMKSLGEEARTHIYSLRESHGLLHPETCTREALIATYRDFAPYFDKKYAKQKGRLRYVDFNQGVDARKFDDEKTALLAQIPVRPLRIAFDNVKTEGAYLNAIRLSVSHGIRDFSNYLLYNFDDRPEDLYYRMRVNVDLCETLDVKIYSFPMKYHPITGDFSHNRDYIGKYWNRKYIRAVQAILNATKGKIGRGRDFFEKAFGRDEAEYMKLLLMPETFLLYRLFFEHIGYTQKWWGEMLALSSEERGELYPIIFRNQFSNVEALTTNEKYRHVLAYYHNYRDDMKDPSSELYRLKQKYDASH